MVVENKQSVLARLLHPEGQHRWGDDPADWDADAIRAAKPSFDLVFGPRRYLRVAATGWENLPEPPALLVSNHSGGTTVLDALGFAWAWIDHFGTGRPLHTMVHDLLFANAVSGRPLARLGALRASHDNARRVLADLGRDLIVYPGGDLDAWRPWAARYDVRFSGRTGYARLALTLGVPVVPVAHAGAHDSLVVLTTGRRLARLLGIHRLARADIWPLHLSLPWGVAMGPLPHLPIPVRFDYRIAAPVPLPAGHEPGRPPTDEAVRVYDASVRSALQHELDELRESRRRFVRKWVRRLTAA